MDLPNFYKNSPCFTTESAEVLYFDESSSDRNFDTSSDDDTQSDYKKDEKNLDSQQEERQQCYYKSLLCVIKCLKNLSVRLKSKSENETHHNNIYRQLRTPKEYVYVRGMSGLSKRVEKLPSSSRCNRCVTRFG